MKFLRSTRKRGGWMPRIENSSASRLDSLLIGLVRAIEPTKTQKTGAQRSHNRLRDLLDTGQIGSRIVNSYLSGSYARDTAIRPIDDVDIVFEIDPAGWEVGIFDLFPAPHRVLESLATAIRYRYPLSSIYGQRRSVRLELQHLNIDVVPAIPDARDASLISIPDRNAAEWIKSSPRRHSENASRVNKKRGGRFKPLVKLLKFWNSNLPDTVRCKSFMIETIAVRIFDHVPFDSLEQGVALFWDFLASRYSEPTIFNWRDNYGMSFGWLSVSVPDAAGSGSNTAASLSNADAKALAAKARISRDRLHMAAKARFAATCQRALYGAFRA